MRGKRKFLGLIFTLLLFSAIVIVRPEVDVIGLGAGFTGILGVFAGFNSVEHKYAKNEK